MYTVKYYKPKQRTINRDVGRVFFLPVFRGKEQISCYSGAGAKFETKKIKIQKKEMQLK